MQENWLQLIKQKTNNGFIQCENRSSFVVKNKFPEQQCFKSCLLAITSSLLNFHFLSNNTTSLIKIIPLIASTTKKLSMYALRLKMLFPCTFGEKWSTIFMCQIIFIILKILKYFHVWCCLKWFRKWQPFLTKETH